MEMPQPARKTFAVILALAAGTLAVYWPLLWHGFLNYDDPDYILNNSHVNVGLTWSGVVWAFKSGYAANWHPLTWISHMLDCQLFDLHPAGHHLVNVLFHTATALLLFILLNQLTGMIWRSGFVAALFAWHPLHVESVAWAAERKDVLSAFFWMLTLLAYTRYVQARHGILSRTILPPHEPIQSSDVSSRLRSILPLPAGEGRGEGELFEGENPLLVHGKGELSTDALKRRMPLSSAAINYCLALLLFVCALMSKPMVVTLPFVLLLLDFWPLQRLNLSTLPRLLVEKIPFFALVFASCFITLLVQEHAIWSTACLPFSFRLANAFMSYVRYISKIFLPTNLALIYPYPHSWPTGGAVTAAMVLVMLSVIFILQAKRFPYLVTGWFWFLGTLVPAIGLVQVGVQAMADRYTYLPSIGFFILVTWGASDLLSSSLRKTQICALAGGAALIACLVLTSIQLSYWRSSLALFTHTIEVTSDNYAADDCLAKTLDNLGFKNEAAQFFEKAVSLEPNYPMAQFDLGMNLIERGDPMSASNHLATAVQLLPGNSVMQYDFGVYLLQHGDTNDAAAHFAAALQDNPDFPEARRELAQMQNHSVANHSTH